MPGFNARTLVEIRRRLQSAPVLEFGLGALAAIHGFLWISWFASSWGVSAASVAALAVSFGVAALLSRGLESDSGGDAGRLRSGALFLVAGWTLAMPGLLSFSLGLLGRVELETLARPGVAGAIHFVAALCLTTPGWIALLQSVKAPSRSGHNHNPSSRVSSWTLAGAAGALFLVPLTLAVWWDLQWIGWTVSGIGLASGAVLWRRPQPVATAVENMEPAPVSGKTDRRILVGDLWTGVAAGTGLALATRVTGQLLAGSAWVAFAELAGVSAGIAAGLWLVGRGRVATRDALPVTATLLIASGAAALVVFFPQLTNSCLRISANVSHTLGIFLLRGGLLVAALFPFGLAIGWNPGPGNRLSRTVGGAALAFAATRVIDVPVPAGITIIVLAAGGLLAAQWLRAATGRRRRLVLATAWLASLIAAIFCSSRFDSSRSARILYSTNAFAAFRTGTPADQLHMIDDGRLVETFDRDGATWTTWVHAGRQLVVRENGFPRGASSLDTRTCPEIPAEMLPAILPLVMHPAPREVTLVGIGGTTALSACLACPVSRVTCIEPHQGMLAIARRCGADGTGPDPFDDPRLHVVRAEPVLATAVRRLPQDVIILNRGHASLWDASADFTTASYRRLADRLAPGGLLCQRLFYGDFGAAPVRDMAATLRAVFPQVMLIETGPGELLFLASREEEAIVEPDVLHRASRPHVRAMLSRLGWDWSVLMAMTSVEAAAIDELADSGVSHTNTVAGARFMFQLPREVARWGGKQEEINELLGGHSTPLYGLIDDEAGVHDLTLRLADVAEEQQIIEQHPDVYWAYRGALRSRLQERPRMTIQQVSHEGLRQALHPEDERRKEYLLALNAAATQSTPDPESLHRLARFAEPHDPLVSGFVHQELAALHARAAVPDPAAELAHRLHAVCFSGARDLSVRNVVAAVNLILEQPQVLPDPRQRWDTLNAMLEVLMRRWRLRTGAPGASRYEASDVNGSFDAADAALDAMEELAPEAGISPDDWAIRRGLLEQHLIRPLRNHRSGQRS